MKEIVIVLKEFVIRVAQDKNAYPAELEAMIEAAKIIAKYPLDRTKRGLGAKNDKI